MMTRYTLPLNDPQAILDVVGGKGASLTRMVVAGLPVPDGFHVTTRAYQQFVSHHNLQTHILDALEAVDLHHPATLEAASQEIANLFENASIPDEIANAIVEAYAVLQGTSPAVAVRSSATAEDLPDASFAGQQDTFLNVRGTAAVLEATRRCWASLWTGRAIGYRIRQGISPEDVSLAVVVQTFIPAEVAGIMFTANPVNGRRDQMVINASWGLGEAVVSGLVSPDSLTLDKSSGRVIVRNTGEKLVQTVHVDGGTEEVPVPENLRRMLVLNDEEAATLVRLGNRIEEIYGIPMDIEWILTEGAFAIVQARPITALPVPEPPVPAEWSLPKGAYAAMRNNIIELMADPLTPLFKTLGLAAVNASMDRMMVGFLGDTGVLPSDPIIAVNEYAYYNGSVKFWPMFKIILDTRGILKRMFTGAVERWTEDGRPRYLEIVKKWDSRPWQELSTREILGAVRQLAEAAVDAYGALVSGVIPAAWMSEAWFTLTYKLFKRKGDPEAPVYLMGFESLPILAEEALYDLATWTQSQSSLAAYLMGVGTAELLNQLGSDQTPLNVDPESWQDWQARFQEYLGTYGHTIYNLDFGNPTPADDPAPILETFKLFLSGKGANPHERQDATAKRRETAVQMMQSRLKGRRLKSFQKNLERAQKYAPLREDGLADVGFSYPLLRRMLREVGARFVQAGMVGEVDDIFWLTQDEIESGAVKLDQSEHMDNLSDLIPQRKAIWRSARRAAPPMMLPQIKVFGVDLVELKSGGLKAQKGDFLKGVPASPGVVTAPACVVYGPQDFSQMETGHVLVAPLTTPAWTPLFARAAAIVTDVGGPLSHGSIVAREYGIPAVLGTGMATRHIKNGQTITVDGSEGVVDLSRNGDE